MGLAQLLGGGGPPPAQHGGAPGSVGFVGGPLDGQTRGGDSGGDGSPQDAVAALKKLIGDLHQYMNVEPDEEDRAVAATCLANLQKLLAKDQKEAEAAVGASPASKFVAKQRLSGPSGP